MLPPSEQPSSSSTTAAAAPPITTLEPVVKEECLGENLIGSKEVTSEDGGGSDNNNLTEKSEGEWEGVSIPGSAEVEVANVDEGSGSAAVVEVENGEVKNVGEDETAASQDVESGEDEKSVQENSGEVAEEMSDEVGEQVKASDDGEKKESAGESDTVDDQSKPDLEIQAEVVATVKNEDDGIVRASFVDFVDDTAGKDDDGEEDGVLMMGNPELQKIREEQVRKWLIFEQENPLGGGGSSSSIGGIESSLTASMEVDSLAAGGSVVGVRDLKLMNGDGTTPEENFDEDVEGREGGDAEGMPRRVRFLTDQEGNLLISVFMTNTPTTPLSDDPSILGSGQGDGNEGDAIHLTEQQSPSLVVSPPSLENNPGNEETPEEELVDSIEPSAPPVEEESGSEDEEEPPSIVLIAPTHPLKEPPREKPPAIPTSDQDSANESSDETLSVSSCNSMIEIVPNEPSPSVTLDEAGKGAEQQQSMEGGGDPTVVTPLFQLGGVMEAQQAPPLVAAVAATPGAESEEDTSASPQPASLIIHELEEHNEGMAVDNNKEDYNEPPVMKVPTVDENNNVVEDSVLEEEEDDDDDVEAMVREEVLSNDIPVAAAVPIPPQFNPEIGEQVMPELMRRSTSSSSGEAEEELERANVQKPVEEQHHQPQVQQHQRQLLMPPGPQDDAHESQMVSLCIQEEHISAVAVTIAKWESMSKAQSTENLSNAGVATPPMLNSSSHAPVTKSASSPCPKTSSGGLLPPQPPQKPAMKPIQPVAPVQTKETAQQQQVNRVLVIHGTNSPASNPLVVTKAAGWSCWGNKVINNKDISAASQNTTPATVIHQQNGTQQENGGSGDEAIYAQPNHQAGSTMTSITNPSAILKSYPKPLSKGEIVNWLREGEIHRAGLLLNYAQSHHHAPVPVGHGGPANHLLSPVLVSWFFGLISRQQAERYLHGQPSGTFLVRISTRIWGYTLSYQASNGRTKHFLISAINPAVPSTLALGPPDAALPPQSSKQQRMSPFLPQGRYAFIGTNMTPYGTLVSLIRHHSHAPITKLGGEKLLNPCPGGPHVAGLENLFQKSAAAAAAIPVTPATSNLMMSSA